MLKDNGAVDKNANGVEDDVPCAGGAGETAEEDAVDPAFPSPSLSIPAPLATLPKPGDDGGVIACVLFILPLPLLVLSVPVAPRLRSAVLPVRVAIDGGATTDEFPKRKFRSFARRLSYIRRRMR